MRINLNIFRILLPLLALLIGSATAQAQDEEGVKYTLTTRCIPADAVSGMPTSAQYEAEASVYLNASGKTGFSFVRWEDEAGNEVSASRSFYYTMPAQDAALIARFEYDPTSPAEPTVPEIKTYATIHVDWTPTDGGSVNAYGTYVKINDNEWKYEVGTNASFSASSRSGFKFVNWTENDEVISTSSSLSFTVEEGGRSIVANFVYDPNSPSEPGEPIFYRRLTLKSNPEAAASSFSGAGEHISGTSFTVSTSANSYYVFDNWTDQDGNIVSEERSFSYTMPYKHTTLTANFHYDFNPSNPGEPDSPPIDDSGVVKKPRMTMKDDTHVMILCATSGATIHYTIDGTEPTTASDVYTEAVFVPGNVTVKAIAVKEGMTDSEVTTYQVKTYCAALPLIRFESGMIKITTATPDATIHYTLDNSDPTPDSPVYTEPLEPDENLLYKAIACLDGLTDSDIAVYVFNPADHVMEGPKFTLLEDGTLQITPEIYGSEIRYTLDGTDPTILSYVYAAPLKLEGNVTVKAIAIHPYYYDSPVSEYVVEGFVVENPTFSYSNLTLAISTATPEAVIRYTLDGSEPTEESALYSSPLSLTEDCKVSARGFKANYQPSEIVSYDFVYSDHQVAAPAIAYDSETLTITLTCETENAEIRYTTDGSDPTATTGIKYEAPIKIEGNATYKARAFRSDLLDSKVVSLVINDQAVPTPTASFTNKLLTLTCEDEAATIRYTVDGSSPTSESTLYTAPVALTTDCTVKFIAQRENYSDSEIGAFNFKKADYQVATPVFAYDDEAGKVTITCMTENAEIRYTVDGSVPAQDNGTKYEGEIAVVGNFSFKARAFRSDLFDSETASLVVDNNQVPTPTATFANRKLSLACADSKATIYYTTDGAEPSVNSAVYENPIDLTQNCTVKFFAVRENYNDSEVANFQFSLADYRVATPVISYNPSDASLTISCATENAEIRYTTDGSEPTATTGTKYEGPVSFYGNFSINARAFRSDLFDSETASLAITGQKVYTPTATFANKQLTLACADTEARIVYTLDGTDPTESSAVYTAPIALTEDCTVRFMAIRESFLDSEIGTYEFKVADHQVAKPAVTHTIEPPVATMTTATEGALIRYTTDGSIPTAETGTAYTAPVSLTGNVTFTVRAFHQNYFDSDTTVYVISNMMLPQPTATYGKRSLTLACEDETAQIRYTTDGTAPTGSSELYSAPIPLTDDCTVRFIAAKTGFVSSDEGSFVFRLADYRETPPVISKDLAGRKVTLSHISGLQISVTLNGAAQTVATPVTLDVTPDMAEISAVTLAQNEDRYDSEPLTEALVFHKAPKLTSDGHTLRVAPGDGEPAAEAAELQLYIDGTLVASGASDLSHSLNGFCAATARVQSNSAFISEVANLAVDAFNTGRLAGARNGHHLEEVIGTWGDKADSYTYLRILGGIDEADLKTLAALPALKTLHIDATLAVAADCKGVLAGSSIETIYSNAYPEGMLVGMPRLTTVMWGSADEAMPEGRLREAGNPNILFWTPAAETAPADATNVVTYSNAPNGAATDPAISNGGAGLTGSADAVTLKAGYPFQAHMPVKAARVEVEKTFSLPTVVDVCAGWETLTLPFDVQQVTHETAGRIVPFARWNGDEEGPKPFWLHAAAAGDWFATDTIQAGVPYIISMPNNNEYVEGFNLAGKVTFSATDVMLGTDYSAPKTSYWKENTEFTGIFMPLDAEAYDKGILSINVKPVDDEYAGSAFVADAETLPFGAYVWAPGQPQSIPVFPDGSGVQLPTMTGSGLSVETPAPGVIRISSSRACRAAIVTPDGATVRTLSLRAGESVTVEGLTRGLYIAAGVKVMVR